MPAPNTSRRTLLLATAGLGAGWAGIAHAQAEQQALVDQSTLSANDLLGESTEARRLLRRARAVMIFPRVFKGGFILGGEGGGGVLVGRDGGGNWTSPAFYGMGSASVGLQIGVSDSQIIVFIMNDRALIAVMDSQFKFGGDASIAVATIGAGIEGSTTAALRADIVTLSKSRGLFAGVSLEGSLMAARSSWNEAYYGRPASAQQIVVGAEVHNPGADPLRAALARWSAMAE